MTIYIELNEYSFKIRWKLISLYFLYLQFGYSKFRKKSIILNFQPEEDDEELELEYLRRRPGDERRGPGDLCGDLLRGGGDLERLGDLLGERLLGGDLRLGGERRLGGDRRRGGDLLRPPPPQEREGEPNGLP